MSDLFSPPQPCLVCGEWDCASRHIPDRALPHARDRFLVPHIIAPYDIFSEVGPTGNAVKLYAAGDPVPLEEALRLGLEAPGTLGGPDSSRRVQRRRPPAPRSETVT